MENTDAGRILRRPFGGRLAAQGAVLDNYHCITHPSQPNYIALAAGSTWGVEDDLTATLDVPHIGDLFEAAGLSWRVYAERYPGGCFTEHSADDLLYVRRHVPFLGFENVTRNEQRCRTHVVNATQLDADIASGQLPAFAMYIPDQLHNGHDTDIDTADAWMESRFGPLLNDARFMSHTLFVLTFDESDRLDTTHITTILAGAGVTPGAVSERHYDHYDLLRTVEELFHVGTLHQEDEKTGERITDVLKAAQ
jgi:phospholipase C